MDTGSGYIVRGLYLAISVYQVMVSSRKNDKVSSAVAELKSKGIICEGIPCHVGSAADRNALVEATIENFGGKMTEVKWRYEKSNYLQ